MGARRVFDVVGGVVDVGAVAAGGVGDAVAYVAASLGDAIADACDGAADCGTGAGDGGVDGGPEGVEEAHFGGGVVGWVEIDVLRCMEVMVENGGLVDDMLGIWELLLL